MAEAYDEKPDVGSMSDAELDEYEGDVLSALLSSANFRKDESEFRRIKIRRNGKVMFTFLIRPLSTDELQKCREKNTKTKRGKYGIDKDKLDYARFTSHVIYEATVPEEKTGGVKLWDYKSGTLWEKLNVASGIDAANAILKPGEKEAVYDAIEKLSGFSGGDIEDDIKN